MEDEEKRIIHALGFSDMEIPQPAERCIVKRYVYIDQLCVTVLRRKI